jgi:cytochrome c2
LIAWVLKKGGVRLTGSLQKIVNGDRMMTRLQSAAIMMLVLTVLPHHAAAEAGACAGHSLEPGRNMTGLSLSGLWNRKAGNLCSFQRYSLALKASGMLWDDKTLDEWIKGPQHLIPGNTMPFPGIKEPQQRADLLAFLREATQPGHVPKSAGRALAAPDEISGFISNRC